MPGFPSWFPVEAGFVLLAVLIAAALLMNRGNWWFLNVLAMDEPLLVALGAAVGYLGLQQGLLLGVVLGGLLAAIGLASRYTGLFNVDSLIEVDRD